MLPHVAWVISAAAAGYAATYAINAWSGNSEPILAMTGVTVIDVRDGARIPRQTVIIEGNRIAAMATTGKVPVPRTARIIDGAGKYLMPGLWEMHAHLGDEKGMEDASFPFFIANGITGIREMAQRFPFGMDSFRLRQREVASGLRIGPRTIGPGADLLFQTLSPARLHQIVTENDARRVVDSLKSAGNTFLKFLDDRMAREPYFAILRAARRARIPVLGHIPLTVTTIEAIDSGQQSIDHYSEMRCWMLAADPLTGILLRPDPDTVAANQRCAADGAVMAKHGTWFVPTLHLSYDASYAAFGPPQVSLRHAQRVVRNIHKQGVPMLAGTDARWPHVKFRAHAALHNELVWMVGAGLTPLEALQAATLNPAKFIGGTDSLGTIAPGKLADLILLSADPLLDIRHTTTIQGVVANGRYFDRTALDSLGAIADAAGAACGGAWC